MSQIIIYLPKTFLGTVKNVVQKNVLGIKQFKWFKLSRTCMYILMLQTWSKQQANTTEKQMSAWGIYEN